MKIVCSILFLFVLSVKANKNLNSDKLLCYGESDNHKAYCSWIVDPNDWDKFKWRMDKLPSMDNNQIVSQQAMCLHRSASLKTSETLTSRLWSPSIGIVDESSSENNVDTSMNFTVDLQPRCVSFSFRFFYPHIVAFGPLSEEVRRVPNLSVLKRQRGSCITVQKGLSGDTSLTCDNKGLFKSGNQLSSDEWLKIMVDLPPTNTDYK